MVGAVLSAVLAIPIIVSTATESSAAVTPLALNGCAAHSLCLYSGASYTGTKWTYTYGGNGGSGAWKYVGAAANDKAYSLVNYRTYVTTIGQAYPNGTYWACIDGVDSTPNLNNFDYPGSSISEALSISSYALLPSAGPYTCP